MYHSFQKTHCFFYLLFLCACINHSSFANEPAINNDQAKTELDSIRSKISDVQKEIEQAKNEAEQLRKELMESEIAATEALTRVHIIKNQIKEQNINIETLAEQKSQYLKELATEKQYLKEQIKTAYKLGRNDYIKLLLNQEDPALVGRMLAYHDYHNRARTVRINNVNEKLQALANIQRSIAEETRTLKKLKLNHEAKLERYSSFRNSRNKIIHRLQNYIHEQDVELHVLQENEHELEALLNQLGKKESIAIEMFEDMPPFDSLKGKLEWPVKGSLIKRFGAPKKGGNLKWQGVMIDADPGTDVQAISTGKVVFADWFRNLGLLLIIDHGNDYMSLYGHNQNLLKKTGDWVLAGETIANVGDSGGQTASGLYFEIRKEGNPVNPVKWCKR